MARAQEKTEGGKRGFLSLWRDQNGIAAVELALILPVALFMLGLAVFGGEGLGIQRKVTLATRDITDLVGQTSTTGTVNTTGQVSINQSTLDYYISLANLIVYPYDPTQLQVEISEVQIPVGVGVSCALPTPPTTVSGTVVWSEPSPGATALAQGSTVSVDGQVACSVASLVNPTYLLLGQMQYNYTPVGIANLLGSMTIGGQIFMIPRSASYINLVLGQ